MERSGRFQPACFEILRLALTIPCTCILGGFRYSLLYLNNIIFKKCAHCWDKLPIEGDACIRQTRCSDCTVRKCSYFVANTSAQLILHLVYGRHSSHDIVGAGYSYVKHERDTRITESVFWEWLKIVENRRSWCSPDLVLSGPTGGTWLHDGRFLIIWMIIPS
jgi:hypothetical protein